MQRLHWSRRSDPAGKEERRAVVGGDQTVKTVDAEELRVPGASGKAFRAVASVRTTDQRIKNSGVDGLDGVRPAETLKFGLVVLKNGRDWTVSEWDVL